MKARNIFIITILFTLCLGTSQVHADMQDDIDRAVSIIERFQEIPESAIPPAVLRDAKGLAIMTVTKAGFIVSGRGGTGVAIARTETGWSGPSAIGTGGIGVGFRPACRFPSTLSFSILKKPSTRFQKVETSRSEAI